MRIHALLTATLLSAAPAFAQYEAQRTIDPAEGFACLANHPAELQRHLDRTPGALEAAMQAKALLDAHTRDVVRGEGARSTYVIPVVVHIIHNNGPENIADEQVYDAVRILNEDFNKLNPDWPSVRPEFVDRVANVGIEFKLAKRDPWGNCTNGITRTVSALTYSGEYEMTQLIQWPRDRYMNVWVCANAGGAAGYTYYPIWLDSWPEADGMVMRHDYLGSIGTSAPSRSRVWGHEVGHWLNLKHCWGDSNEPGSDENCFMDDEVEDTPLTRGWTSCFLGGNSCGSPLDNVENYMEYSYCARMFTNGQADRMIAALTSPIAQRNNLWQSATLAATGVSEEGLLCEARFAHGATEICAGGSVSFRDESFHGITVRNWSFPGGVPATASAAQVVVTYPEPGVYPVTLSVSDGSSGAVVERPSLVVVLPATGEQVPLVEGFEGTAPLEEGDWVVRNPDGDVTFAVTNAAAASGQYSLRLVNGPERLGRKDDLVSTTFDLRNADSIHISYRYAFARRNGANEDRLRVYVSRDCGATWSLRQQLRAEQTLATAGNVMGAFVPNADQWARAEVTNISQAFRSRDFRLRFEFESGGGNDLFLDDININGAPVGMAELNGDGVLMVVPNPSGPVAQVWITLPTAQRGELRVLDALGRVVYSAPEQLFAGAARTVEVPLPHAQPGTYLLELRTAEGRWVRRFVRE